MEINGKPVVNGKRKLVIDISERDVKKGQTRDPACCAAAQCLLRTVPGIIGARVHMTNTYIEYPDRWERLMTPMSLRKEIIAFDRGAAFYPGQYGLSPLSPSHQGRYGKRQGGATPAAKRKRKKIARAYHQTAGVREHGANR